MRGAASLLICLAVPALLAAQAQPTVAEHIALGDSAHAALAPQQALGHYRAALARDSTNYAALWKAGREAVDIAKQIEGKDDSSKQVRDSLYVLARAYGEAAVRANPNGADGHFTVGQALGRLSRTKGGKERVRFAKLIYDEGMKALELDSTHDGANHLIGAWHAEVKRLSGFQKFFAKTLFGGGFLDKGNWEDAQRYLARAVALKPQNIFHRLELAETMIALGEDRGCPTVALLTAMDRPLGRACGNALETEEAILALRGEGPADLMEVTYALGVEMLLAAGVEKTSKKARQRLENALGSGLAAEKFERVIEAQGGNPKVVEDASVLPQALEVEVYNAPRTGVVQRVEPKIIGRAVVAMGGGRLAVDDAVDPTVGFVITVNPGDKVPAGEPIASVFAKDPAGIKLGFEALQQAIVIGDKLTEKPLPLISHRVTKDGVEELKR